MTTNLSLASIKATGGTTSRTFGTRWADIINVKDYGATGDGVTDDMAAIQAAFDAAFGTQASPHGNANRFLNKPVFFPAGNYLVGGPLYLTAVYGGHIFGSGSQNTRISYTGNLASGNNVIANGITPIIMMEMNHSTIEGLNLAIADSGGVTVGIYLFGNTASCNANVFSDLLMEGGTAGILVGYQTIQTAVSECLYINVTFAHCGLAGLRVTDANALNHWVYGGGGFDCGNGGYGATSALYSCNSGSIPIISGTGNASNLWDIYNNGAVSMSIIGCRTESLQFANLDTIWANISACQQAEATPGTLVAFLATSGSSIVTIDSSRCTGTVAGISGAGKIYLRGNTFTNASFLSSFTGIVSEFDIPNGLVSALPTANAKYKGLRALVTDATATTFMSTVAGTGGNIVPVVCDGTNWKIG